MRRVVGRGGGASGLAALQLAGGVGHRVVQAVVVQHGDHFLFDQLLGQLQVQQLLHGGRTQDRLVDLGRDGDGGDALMSNTSKSTAFSHLD